MRPAFPKRARGAGALFATLCSVMSGIALADGEPGVTPYRPTVSNPADLPVPGWLEAEFGGLRVFGDAGARDDSVPWLIKYAFDEDRGLLLGGNAYVAATTPGEATQRGIGDTTLEWKQRFALAEGTAFGVEGGVTLPSARHGLGAGKPLWLVNGIFSSDLGATHLDVNVGAAHATQHDLGTSAWQQSAAACASWSFDPSWGGALEVSGTHQRGTATQSQALAALNYNVSPRLVLDAGVARGLTHHAHDRSIFAGATVLLGHVH
jgi:hypothetical protein